MLLIAGNTSSTVAQNPAATLIIKNLEAEFFFRYKLTS
jgi:hypothetical protein